WGWAHTGGRTFLTTCIRIYSRSCAMLNDAGRFQRQDGLVPQDILTQLDLTILGVGAIGRQVALQLVALGARKLQLCDFDVVELTNVTTQGYWPADIGSPKVEAIARTLRLIDPNVALTLIQDRFRPHQAVGDVVFSCVDSISARTAIWRNV